MSREPIRRATVLLLQSGDPEIAGAIAEGMLAARAEKGNDLIRRGASAAPPSPKGEGFESKERTTIVSAEMDRQRVAALVHVAVGNTLTAEDYRRMTEEARAVYAVRRQRGPLRRWLDRLTTGWALLCYAVAEAHAAQRHVLGGPGR